MNSKEHWSGQRPESSPTLTWGCSIHQDPEGNHDKDEEAKVLPLLARRASAAGSFGNEDLPKRETDHEMEPPNFHQKLRWFLWSPPAAFHWCKPPFSDSPGCRSRLTSKLASHPGSWPLWGSFPLQTSIAFQMSDLPVSLALLLVLGRSASLPQATVSHQDAENLSIFASERYIHCRNLRLAVVFFRSLDILFPVSQLLRFLSRSWLEVSYKSSSCSSEIIFLFFLLLL